MNKRASLAAVAVMMLGVGCGLGGLTEQCQDTGISCSKGGRMKACCTVAECRYVASDGTVFKCSGTDCASGSPSAAQQAASWCISH